MQFENTRKKGPLKALSSREFLPNYGYGDSPLNNFEKLFHNLPMPEVSL